MIVCDAVQGAFSTSMLCEYIHLVFLSSPCTRDKNARSACCLACLESELQDILAAKAPLRLPSRYKGNNFYWKSIRIIRNITRTYWLIHLQPAYSFESPNEQENEWCVVIFYHTYQVTLKSFRINWIRWKETKFKQDKSFNCVYSTWSSESKCC